MNILKGILADSKKHYQDVKKKIAQKLSKLPKGSVKERKISGHKYFYLQQRINKKVVHKYLGKAKPEKLIKDLKLRKSLEAELKKVDEALKMIRKSEGKDRKIKTGKKYETSGLTEDQYEPGSQGRVLKNLLGIIKKREIDKLEYQEQVRTLKVLIKIYKMDHAFKEKDICRIHKIWLGKIYSWAGQYRHVNMTKGGFTFAASHVIPQLMQEFENGALKELTPCRFAKHEEIVHALAVVHTELVLIHPFREGNGRLARLVAILMGLQAQLPPLDFGGIKGKKREAYFAAVRAGLSKNYSPMEKVFHSIIRRTLKKVKKK